MVLGVCPEGGPMEAPYQSVEEELPQPAPCPNMEPGWGEYTIITGD